MGKILNAVQYGLGPIGCGIVSYLARKRFLRLVGAVDIDPAKQGRDAGLLAGLPEPLGVPVTGDPEAVFGAGEKIDVVFLATGSTLEAVEPQVLEIVSRGVNVVSTCEEMAWPWLTAPEKAAAMDARAREHGVSVLGTGVNPGFLMDFLPLALTGVCQSVESVLVERFQNASHRRLPFQKKIGAGLEVSEFRRRVGEKTIRHVGLTESMHMVAHRLGWSLERTSDLVEPVIAESDFRAADQVIPAGRALGVNQVGRGWSGGREVITLVFRAALGEPEAFDRVVVKGDPPIDMKIAGGVNGDKATCAVVVNAAPVVVRAVPGLRTMADIEPVSCPA